MEKLLVNKDTFKSWKVCCTGNKIVTVANGGKEREKCFNNTGEAEEYTKKEIWNRLKKGFVFNNDVNRNGEVILHKYLGSGYTGAIPIASSRTDNSIYVARTIGESEDTVILHISEQGEVISSYSMGANKCIWEMCICKNKLLMNCDHEIFELDLNINQLKKHTTFKMSPVSILKVGGNRAVWYNAPYLIVYDFDSDKEIYKKEVEPEEHDGYMTQLQAVLSYDGTRLVYCVNKGKIECIELDTGKERIDVKITNEYVYDLFFAPDNELVFIATHYQDETRRCFEFKSGEVRVELELKEVRSVRVEPTKKYIGIVYNKKIKIFSFDTQKLVLEINVDYVVRTMEFCYTKSTLAMHTDYGCLNLYYLGEDGDK